MVKRDLAPAPQRVEYAYADALRALAIFGIAFVHVAQYAEPHFVISHFDLARALAYLSTIGVACLFVLSGFLLAPPFLRAYLDPALPEPALGRFFLKRFLRIYPLYAAALVFVTVYVAIDGLATSGVVPVSFWDVIAHVLFLQDFSYAYALTLDSPLWTMPVDVEFYVALPLCFALARVAVRRQSRGRRVWVLRAGLAAVAVSSIGFRALVLHLYPVAAERFIDQVIWLKNVVGMAAAFAFGIWVAFEVRFEPWAARAQPRLGAFAIAAGALVALVHAASRSVAPEPNSLGFVAGFALYDAVAAAAAAAILFGFAIGRFHGRGVLADGTNWQRAAALSYAVYLLHYPIVQVLGPLVHVPSRNASFVFLLVACAVVLAPLAWLSHRYVERPFLELKSRVPT